MKKHIFKVEIEFADDVTDDKHINQMASNIAKAIKKEKAIINIAPVGSDTYVKDFAVETVKDSGELNFRVATK